MNAPEKCLICSSPQYSESHGITRYHCGIKWYSDIGGRWSGGCDNATTAALRCGATLEPTPLELARQALVDAAVRERGAWQTLNAALDADFDTTWQHAQAHHAASETFDAAVAAYRALLEPAP